MLNKKLLITIGLLPSCLLSTAMAQNNETPTADSYWTLNGHFISTAIDSKVANMSRVKDQAMNYALNADFHSGSWLTSLAVGFFQYKDLDKFSQTVIGTGWGNRGDVEERSSDASALLLSVAVGPKWQFGSDSQFTAAVQAGYSHLARSERSITSCSNCYKEKINVDAGAFADASLQYSFGSWQLGLLGRQQLSGDLGTAVGVTIGWRL